MHYVCKNRLITILKKDSKLKQISYWHSLKTFLFCIISLSYTSSTFGQIKAMYVNDFKYIVGDIPKEDELLSYAQDSGFNYLIFYNLYYIHNNLFDLTDPVASQPLADFLSKAKDDYGILYAGAVGETFNSFANIHDYNLDHLATPSERFDIYNLEFEFWNLSTTGPGGYYCTTYLEPAPCDTVEAFNFSFNELCRIDSLTGEYPWLSSEVYIGNPSVTQCAKLATCVDRILVHYYRSSDTYAGGNSIYNYKKYRMEALTDSVASTKIMPIFAGTPSFMGTWLETHPESQAFETWMYGVNAYDDEMGAWTSKVTIDGYVWYRWTDMKPDIPLPIILISFEGKHLGKNYLLTWQYQANPTLSHIDIEVKTKANTWQKLQTSTPLNENKGQYLDENIYSSNVQYRLKFIDKDGQSEYSKIIARTVTSTSNILLYPQPTKDVLNIKWPNKNSMAQVQLFNNKGQLLLKKEGRFNTINLDKIQDGLYLLKIIMNGQTTYKKCIIHR